MKDRRAELADTFIYLKKIGDHFSIDLIDAALNRGRIQKR